MTNFKTALENASHGAPHEKHFKHAELHDNYGVGTYVFTQDNDDDDDFLRSGRFLDFNRKGLRSFSNALDADVFLLEIRAGRARSASCEEK